MNILFIHQNFPAQFRFLAPALAVRGHRVVAMTMQRVAPQVWQGVTVIPYGAKRGSTPGIHPWMTDFETKVIRGEACYRAAKELAAGGFSPDVIIAHPGWGESLFLKDVWPKARLGMYCEFYYHAEGADVGFDPEFAPLHEDEACRLRMKNLNNLIHFELADAGLAPTEWQASTFPLPFRSRISVIHDGIDTWHVAPNPLATFRLADGTVLSRQDEVVTFVNRNLEPYRGYHVFMRALPEMLRQRPGAHFLIVGGDGVSYGAPPPQGESWKDRFIAEIRDNVQDADWKRVHFLGKVPYENFLSLLQISSVHVYLTYPFVLSWSLLEALSAGCAVVASDTPPLHEAVKHGETGVLVDFFDHAGLANAVCVLLDDLPLRDKLGQQARALACARYDLAGVCLPLQLNWVEGLAA